MVAEDGRAAPGLVPHLEALFGHWQRHYGTQPIPDRSRLDPAGLGPWTRHVVWIDAAPGNRFRIRDFGVDLIRRFGREATGNDVDELALDIAEGLRRGLERAIATAAPVAGSASVPLGREAAVFCDLILPLAAERGRVTQFLFASYEIRNPNR
ncbi:MAG TPA: PAS domain-containing protein [Rhizomicrobium sp.]|nr:PAS domain-containing protein [Rhizomicrobium sp.]